MSRKLLGVGSDALVCHYKLDQVNTRSEPGGGVFRAVQAGCLEPDRLENYHKMEAELRCLETKTDLEARRWEKDRMKQPCKAQREIYNGR